MWHLIVKETFPSDDGKVSRVMVSYKNKRPREVINRYAVVKYTEVERPVERLIDFVTTNRQL